MKLISAEVCRAFFRNGSSCGLMVTSQHRNEERVFLEIGKGSYFKHRSLCYAFSIR